MPETIRSPRQELLIRRLTEARKTAGFTQAELAARFGRHQPFIANIESGQRRVDLVELIALADVVGLDLHRIIEELRGVPAGPQTST
ncbi:MAG: DNA-binding protein [Devosia sp.]|uniref:helix-turn-helix domain-containing protein n=1 Tax=Devosia sp. TaxID=1871048 RepID=UPI00261ABB06|nr:helix-turn-helix transcriptional regulator [Devosia sp.]MDB5530749.1 DNA-binding protein [Devosia sp.]